MPGRVSITFEANTAEAQKAIAQFARGAADAFDKLKSGEPVLQGATVKTQQYTQANTKATSSLQSFTVSMSAVPGPIGQAASAVQQLSDLLSGPAGLVAAALAAGTAAVTMANSFASTIERLDNLSQTTGLSVASLQAFEQAAVEAGEAPDTLVRGFGKINDAIAETIKGNDKAGESFRAIGVDLKAMVTSGASTEEILEAVAKALAGIEDQTKRSALQTDIFTVKGRAINAVLKAVAEDGAAAYIDKMREAGIVTSEAANRAATEWDTFMDEAGRSMTGFTNQLKGDVVVSILALRDAIVLVKGAMDDLLGDGASWTVFWRTWQAGLVLIMGPAALVQWGALIAKLREAREAREAFTSTGGDFGDRTRQIMVNQEKLNAELERFAKETERAREEADRFAESLKQWQDQGTEKFVRLLRIETEKLWKEVQDAADRFDGFGAGLASHVQTWRDWNDRINANVAVLQQSGEKLGDFRNVIDGVRDGIGQLEPKFSILGEGAKKADKLAQLFHELGQGVGGVDEALAKGSVSLRGYLAAWDAFEAGFQGVWQRAGDTMLAFHDLGAKVAVTTAQAFSDLFFSVMDSGFSNLADVGKNALRALERAVADFLASAAVRGLGGLFGDLLGGLFGGQDGVPKADPASSPGEQAGAAAAGAAAGALVDWLIGQSTHVGQSIAESIIAGVDEHLPDAGKEAGREAGKAAADGMKDGAKEAGKATKDAAKESGSVIGRAIDGAIRGAATGFFSGLAAGNPMSAIGGGILGGLLGAAKSLIGDAVKAIVDFAKGAMGLGDAMDAASKAALDAADQARDGAMGLGAFGDSMKDAMDAADAARDGAMGLTDSTNAATGATLDASAAVGAMGEAAVDFGSSVAEAGAAVSDAADAAGAAAAAASAAADRAADAAADAGGGGGGGDPGPSGHDPGGDNGDAGGQGPGGLARGGIVTSRHLRTTLHGPEAVIPLNERGRRFAEAAFGAGGGTDEDRALMREQNRLLNELVGYARRRRAAGAAAVI